MRKSADGSKPNRRKVSGTRRAVLLLLNLVIIALIATGVYLIGQPYYLHWRQDRKTAELLQAVDTGTGEVVLFADELKVPGEEEEFTDAVEQWDTTEPAPSDTEEPVPSESTTGSAAQPVASKSVTPKPTPAPVVIKAIGTIYIDKISLKMPIADSAGSAQLRVAVGLLGGSSMPGTPGNAIILGHRMYTYGRHFNRLDEVTAGSSVVIVTTAGRKITYTVDRQAVILPTDLRLVLSQPTKEKQLILVTCTPVRVASHRLLVYCRQVSDEPA